MAKTRKLDNIERDVVAAMKLGYGVHYGHYKADYPHTKDCSPTKDHPQSLPDAGEEFHCALCGKVFLRSHGGQKYCSDECRLESNKKREKDYYLRKRGQLPQTLCPECGNKFQPMSRRQKYCCTRCASQAGWKKQAQRRKEARNGDK